MVSFTIRYLRFRLILLVMGMGSIVVSHAHTETRATTLEEDFHTIAMTVRLGSAQVPAPNQAVSVYHAWLRQLLERAPAAQYAFFWQENNKLWLWCSRTPATCHRVVLDAPPLFSQQLAPNKEQWLPVNPILELKTSQPLLTFSAQRGSSSLGLAVDVKAIPMADIERALATLSNPSPSENRPTLPSQQAVSLFNAVFYGVFIVLLGVLAWGWRRYHHQQSQLTQLQHVRKQEQSDHQTLAKRFLSIQTQLDEFSQAPPVENTTPSEQTRNTWGDDHYPALIQQALDGVFIIQKATLKFANPAIARILGYTIDDIQGAPFIQFIAPEYRSKVAELYERRKQSDRRPMRYEAAVITKAGFIKDVEVSLSDISFDQSPATMGILRDISDRKRVEKALKRANEKLKQLTITDSLTGLYNRRYLMRKLSAEFDRSVRYRTPLSLFMLDIDRFKDINDQHGHSVGDKVLQRLAQVLQDRVRSTDIVARYGGEEMTIILPHTEADAASYLAKQLCETIAKTPFTLSEQLTLWLTVSIGVSYYPSPQVHHAEQLLNVADQALYEAKGKGRNCVVTEAVA